MRILFYLFLIALIPVTVFIGGGSLLTASGDCGNACFGIGWAMIPVYFIVYFIEWGVLAWKKQYKLLVAAMFLCFLTPVAWLTYLMYFA